MITNERERKTCEKYSEYDETGRVNCNKCPLRKGHGSYDFRCKANSHYNRKTREWEWDEVKEEIVYFDFLDQEVCRMVDDDFCSQAE